MVFIVSYPGLLWEPMGETQMRTAVPAAMMVTLLLMIVVVIRMMSIGLDLVFCVAGLRSGRRHQRQLGMSARRLDRDIDLAIGRS